MFEEADGLVSDIYLEPTSTQCSNCDCAGVPGINFHCITIEQHRYLVFIVLGNCFLSIA